MKSTTDRTPDSSMSRRRGVTSFPVLRLAALSPQDSWYRARWLLAISDDIRR